MARAVSSAFIENPRRHPRVPVRLRVKGTQGGEGFLAETEDIGPGGCLLVSQQPLGVGQPLRLAIGCEGLSEKLLVLGHVAWHQASSRMRSGVSFDARQSGSVQPKWWFEQMIAAQPGVAARLGPTPSRLFLDAPVYLLPPPRHILDLSADEARTLSAIDNRASVREILDRWPELAEATQRALFGLFEKRALTLSMGSSAPAWQWREALARMEEDGLLPQGSAMARPSPRPAVGVPPRAAPVLSREPVARPLPARGPAQDTGRPSRPREAQTCLDRAREMEAAGQLHGAIGLLRRALELSPHDAEVAKLLGTLAFRGRVSS